jgi:CRP-like cAMP-binding protein
LFSYLTDKDLKGLLSVSEIIAYKKGDIIISQGDASQFLFAVLEGNVHVSLQDLKDKDVLICRIGPGEVFGEAAIFMAEKRTANVISSKPTVAVRIHRKDLMSYVRHNPVAGNKILMIIIYGLLKKLKDANQELAFEKQSDMDFDGVDSLIQDFMRDI